jgi:dGTPase
MKSRKSAGRRYPEKEHPYRSVYQRDKDRVIYSTAFRRLEYKTQVFVNHEGDYYRTRLTHTLEVAQIARTIARALRLNEDLVEVLALAHDLGHTPFGHSGEDTLNELMRDRGGFDHNSHGLRVVDLLEERYPDFLGLNLSREVRRGILKHKAADCSGKELSDDLKGPYLLEIQAVDIADEIAYDNHDLDDGLKSSLLSEKDLSGLSLWEEAREKVLNMTDIRGVDIKRYQGIRYLINMQVSDVIENSLRELNEMGLRDPEDLKGASGRILGFTLDMQEKRKELRSFLHEKLYKHYRVIRMSRKASRFLRALFENYVKNPDQLPPQTHSYLGKRGKWRVVSDYLAGMTDRYALDQYKKLFEPYERV